MPAQKKGKATPKTTPSKASPKSSPKGRGVTKPASPKIESPVVRRESRSSTPSKVVESPKAQNKKVVTPTKPVTPKSGGKPAAAKPSPKGKPATPKSNKSTPRKATPKARQESESSESEDENTEFKVGDLIDAAWDDGLFYSAKVIKVNKNKTGTTYNVEFTQDKVQAKGLKRNQIQSYSEDADDSSEAEVTHKHKTIDDEEYEEGQDAPLRDGDESVESDSTEAPRKKKAGRKPANKRKREVQTPTAEKKQKLAESLGGLSEKQLISLVKKVCNSNVKIMDAVQSHIPEPKVVAAKPKSAPKKPAVVEKKTAPQKNAKIAPKKGGKQVAVAPKKAATPTRKSGRGSAK